MFPCILFENKRVFSTTKGGPLLSVWGRNAKWLSNQHQENQKTGREKWGTCLEAGIWSPESEAEKRK